VRRIEVSTDLLAVSRLDIDGIFAAMRGMSLESIAWVLDRPEYFQIKVL
jgi:hypothetical protein